MKTGVILDTGPLIASLNRRDHHHEWALTQLGQIAPPMLTCDAVLAESCFLLRQNPVGVGAVLEMVRRGIIDTSFAIGEHVDSITKLMKKYASVPMSLADACLVRLSELSPKASVLTLDAEFRIYRRLGRQSIPLLTLPKL